MAVEAGHGRECGDGTVGRIELPDDRHLPAPERPARDRRVRLGGVLGSVRRPLVRFHQLPVKSRGMLPPTRRSRAASRSLMAAANLGHSSRRLRKLSALMRRT